MTKVLFFFCLGSCLVAAEYNNTVRDGYGFPTATTTTVTERGNCTLASTTYLTSTIFISVKPSFTCGPCSGGKYLSNSSSHVGTGVTISSAEAIYSSSHSSSSPSTSFSTFTASITSSENAVADSSASSNGPFSTSTFPPSPSSRRRSSAVAYLCHSSLTVSPNAPVSWSNSSVLKIKSHTHHIGLHHTRPYHHRSHSHNSSIGTSTSSSLYSPPAHSISAKQTSTSSAQPVKYLNSSTSTTNLPTAYNTRSVLSATTSSAKAVTGRSSGGGGRASSVRCSPSTHGTTVSQSSILHSSPTPYKTSNSSTATALASPTASWNVTTVVTIVSSYTLTIAETWNTPTALLSAAALSFSSPCALLVSAALGSSSTGRPSSSICVEKSNVSLLSSPHALGTSSISTAASPSGPAPSASFVDIGSAPPLSNSNYSSPARSSGMMNLSIPSFSTASNVGGHSSSSTALVASNLPSGNFQSNNYTSKALTRSSTPPLLSSISPSSTTASPVAEIYPTPTGWPGGYNYGQLTTKSPVKISATTTVLGSQGYDHRIHRGKPEWHYHKHNSFDSEDRGKHEGHLVGWGARR